MKNIEILLASYNGQQYITEMINSILEQDCQNWHLTVSDDQSSDGTAEILESFSRQYPEKITHYRSGRRFGNAQDHFMHLLKKFHDAPYIMFCDQDDVWHTDKIRKTFELMQKTEASAEIPTAVHTDLRVVDQNLEEIHSSFLERSALRGDRMQLNHLLVQNVMTGCTMMINRALAELACANIPQDGIRMHDWWLAILASACGNTGFLNEATIDYRQHGNNSVGAKNVRSIKHIVKQMRIAYRNMEATFIQADSFLKCYSHVLPEESAKLVSIYAEQRKRRWFARKKTYLKYGFLKNGFTRVVGQLLLG